MPPSADDLDFARYRDHADAAALAQVFDRTAPKLLLLASHWTRDPAAAEDLVQVTFVQALRDAAQWDQRLPLLKWLAGILAHRAMDARKRAALRAAAPLDAAMDVPTRERSPLDAAMDGEMFDRVTAAVDGLEEPYHGVLVLRLVHGLEPTAIAHALGRPPATVRKQLERGLQQLRGALPATLAVLLAGLVASGRGLAAVRTAVLIAGRCGAPAAGAAGATGAVLATTGGVLVMNKLLVSGALAVLALGALLWWSQIGGPVQAPAGSGQPGQPTPVAATLPKDTAAEVPVQRTVDDGGPAAAAVTASLEVLVLDDKTGTPVPGIGIDLVPRDGREERLTTQRASTDAQGIARFAPLATGPHHVHVDVEALDGEAGADVDAIAGPPQRITFRLPTGVTVHGTVVDPGGQPVAGATVLRHRSGGIARDNHPAEAATTDTAGAFELRALQGPLTLQAVEEAHAPSPLLSLLPEASGKPIVLQLGDQPARLQGVVTRAGVAVANAAVTLERNRPTQTRVGDTMLQSHTNSATRTTADGRFEFGALVPGPTTLNVLAGGAAPQVLEVTLASGATREVAIDLLPAARLCGHVLDQDGSPIPGASAWCGAAGTHTPADGHFEFDCLQPGPAKVGARAAGYCSRQQPVDLIAGQETTCELRLERLPVLAGRVLDTADHGLAGLVVTAIRVDLGRGNYRPMTDGQGRMDDLYGRNTTTDAYGSFALPVMPGVAYLLDVSEKGQWLSIYGDRFGEFEAPRNDLLLTIQPEDLATAFVQGRIVDADLEPVARAWLQISDGTRLGTVGTNTPGTRRSDADGRFCIGPIPAHAYRIRLHPPGSELPQFDMPEFRLQPGQKLDLGDVTVGGAAQLSVHLAREGGGVFEGAMLQLDGDNRTQQIFTFDAAGNLAQGLAPGHYELTIYSGEVAQRIQSLVLTAGERKQLEFTLPQGIRFGLCVPLPAGETFGQLVIQTADGSIEYRDDLDADDRDFAPPQTTWPSLSPGAHQAELTCSSGRRYTASFAVLEQPHEPGKPPPPCELLWQPAK